MISVLEQRDDGIAIIGMKSEQLEVVVTNYGCTILKVMMEDKNGHKDDVVLGYDTIEEYQQHDGYLGALVGRVANRIKEGRFTLHGKEYTLAINSSKHHLHGGIKGFSYQIFDYEIVDDHTVSFHYVSKDGEEGYPGTLDFVATYTLIKGTLFVTYNATSSKDTLINITNHSYFNLSGKTENIYNHTLSIKADTIACIDNTGLPTGNFKKVAGTAFDFTTPTTIGSQIEKDDEQLILGTGFDHPFIFNSETNQVILSHEASGRRLVVSTTLPQAQIYTANFLDGRLGKYGQHYNARDAVCIETQNLPDAIHLEKEPSTLLKEGEVYEETTSYTFEVIK